MRLEISMGAHMKEQIRLISIATVLCTMLASCKIVTRQQISVDHDHQTTSTGIANYATNQTLDDISSPVSSEELSVLLQNSDLDCASGDTLQFDGEFWTCSAGATSHISANETYTIDSSCSDLIETLDSLASSTVENRTEVTIQILDGSYECDTISIKKDLSFVSIIGNLDNPSAVNLIFNDRHGLSISSGKLGLLDGLTIEAVNQSSATRGINLNMNSSLNIGRSVVVKNWISNGSRCISAADNSTLKFSKELDGQKLVLESCYRGIHSYANSIVTGEGVVISGNNTPDSVGIYAVGNSFVYAEKAQISNYDIGVSSEHNSYIRVPFSTIDQSNMGARSSFQSTIQVWNSTFTNISLYGFNTFSNGNISANYSNVTCAPGNTSSMGFRAIDGGQLQAVSSSSSNCAYGYYAHRMANIKSRLSSCTLAERTCYYSGSASYIQATDAAINCSLSSGDFGLFAEHGSTVEVDSGTTLSPQCDTESSPAIGSVGNGNAAVVSN